MRIPIVSETSDLLVFTMTRKRPRVRAKPKVKVAVDILAFPAAETKEAMTEGTAVDSGNDSPHAESSRSAEKWNYELVSHHRDESIKAWVCGITNSSPVITNQHQCQSLVLMIE